MPHTTDVRQWGHTTLILYCILIVADATYDGRQTMGSHDINSILYVVADATYDGRQTMGSYDNHTLVDTWSFSTDSTDNKIIVTADSCTPIVYKYVVTKGIRKHFVL